jgi:prepilin-type N-terminal cleavage/methylation domain-containing protein
MTPWRSHHRLAAEEGFTLTELLVAMTISVIVLLATLDVFDAFTNGVAANTRLTDATGSARRQVATMVSGLREAGAPGEAATIQQALPNDIVFVSTAWPGQSDVGVGNAKHIERYCLDTSTRKVWFNGLKAGTSGSPLPGSACPSTNSGWTSDLVASDVLNTAADPLFSYGSTNPVRSIAIRLLIEGGTALKSRALVLRSGVALRGALAPRVSAGDITVGPCNGNRALLSANLAALPGAEGATMSVITNGTVVSVPAGPGRILGPPTSPFTVTITNLVGLKTEVPMTVSC